MYIKEISIGKFRHLENTKIVPLNFNPKASDLTVIAGPNGSGKSSILELIGYALSNSYSLAWSLSRTFNNFSFEVAIGLTKNEKQIIIDSLRSELQPVEQKLKDERKILEDTITDDEPFKQARIKEVAEQTIRPFAQHYDILDYFKSNSIYYRSFQYP